MIGEREAKTRELMRRMARKAHRKYLRTANISQSFSERREWIRQFIRKLRHSS
jgi:hypothetical protein